MIFGWQWKYEDLLEKARLSSLAERREERVKKFAVKIESSSRFKKKWLEENEIERKTRKVNLYKEKRTKTIREDKNPVTWYTRVLNKIHRQ